MAGCFMIGELPQELRVLGHDVPDPVIVSCLSQMQLTDHCYEKSTSLVTSRAANDRSSPLSCVRAGKSPRHEHGPPVPGDRDFRQEADSIFPNCTLATELEGLKKMLRVMGETKEELLGSLNGPGVLKRRIPQADEDEDAGKTFGEWRLVGRTLRPIDNNVVAGDSFKATALAQNLKGENQFYEPLVYAANENAKGDHQFNEPLVPYCTNEHPEPTKPPHVGEPLKHPSLNTANTKKNHGSEVASLVNEHWALVKCAELGDSLKPASVVSYHNKENPVFDTPVSHAEPSESIKSISHKEEGIPQKADACHAGDTSLSGDGVTLQTMSQDRKETRKLTEERDITLRSKGGFGHLEEEDTTSSDTTIASSDTLTTEEEDCASNLKGGQGSKDWMSKKTSPEFLREERILKAAIEAGASYYHDGVVYRENLVYDMIRSPSSGTQEDILESNHDLEEFRKPAPRKKSYNPELFSLSNDHFLEAFERSLAELDPKDTIDQETFASVTRNNAESEHFHQFNFASLANFRLEDENLLDFNSPLLVSSVPATNAAPDPETTGPLASLDDPRSLLSDNSKEVNQFLLDEEGVHESAEEVNQFFLGVDTLTESADDIQQVLDDHAVKTDSFSDSVLVPATPDQIAEVNPPPRKGLSDSSIRLTLGQAKTLENTHEVVASALKDPTQAVSKGEEENDARFSPSSDEFDAAPGSDIAVVDLFLDSLRGTANTYQEELVQRRFAVELESGVRSSADHPSVNRISTVIPRNFSSEGLNESHLAGGLDRGISGHLEPLNDRSNIPTANADDLNQRPRPKTITDFFNPSEMTLRRPSTIEIKKRDKETRNLLRAADQKSTAEQPVDHLRFALPPPSSRGNSRRHSLSEKSLEIAGLALTPIKVPSRDRVCATHGPWDQAHGFCSQCSHGAPKRRGESRVFGASGSKSPQVESTPHRKSGETASPFSGVAGSQSPYGKIQSGFLKKGGGGAPSPSGSAAGSKTPQTPKSTTSSGSEASPNQNPFKRNSGIYSSLVARDKRSGDSSSVLLSTSRLSTSVNFPSSSRMSTSVNLPSASERSSNQRQSSTRSGTESLHSAGSLKRSPAQDIKRAADSSVSKPAFNTSTVVAKSRTISSTTTTKEKLTPGTTRRTQSVKDRVTR